MSVNINELSFLRANGGYLVRAIPDDSYEALCGYKPSSPTGGMFKRGRWTFGLHTAPTCKKCKERLARLEAAASNANSGDANVTRA